MIALLRRPTLCSAVLAVALLGACGNNEDNNTPSTNNTTATNNTTGGTNNTTGGTNNTTGGTNNTTGGTNNTTGGTNNTTGGTNNTTGETLTFAAFKAQANEALLGGLCDAAVQCPTKIEEALLFSISRYSTADACKTNEASGGLFDPREELGIQAAIDAGRTTFNAAEAKTCLDALKAAFAANALCQTGALAALNAVEGCEPFTGTIAEGQPCVVDEECAGANAGCDTEDSQTCGGTCAVYVDGQECGDTVCEAGMACTDTADGGEKCTTAKQAGESCGVDEGGCDWTKDLKCFKAGLGDATGTCVAERSVDVGQPCGNDNDFCKIGAFCHDPDNVCTENVLAKSGEQCSVFGPACQPGLVCVSQGFVGECAAPLASGAQCTLTSECAPGLVCDPTSETCSAKLADGADCFENAECQSSFCDYDNTETCRPVSEAACTL